MASSAVKASSSSSSPPRRYSGKWEYDVFLCFRGDTRLNFMSHVREALREKQIEFFVDTMLTVTEDINELLAVLKKSAVSVVIFSEKFAESTWCLDEVDTIARSVAEFGHKVLPVFYKVDWTAVAGNSGAYAETIAELVDEDASEERKKQWRDALKAVAGDSGAYAETIAELVHKDATEELKKQYRDALMAVAGDSGACAEIIAKLVNKNVTEERKKQWRDGLKVLSVDSGAYAETIAKLVDEDATEKRREQWRDALKAVAHKTGRTSEAIPDDAKLVKQVVDDVLSTLAAMSSSIQFSNLVGIDSRVLEVERLLAMNKIDDIRIVGLRGMGGAGKTTLARSCYEKLRLSAKDTKFHFVERIGENRDKPYGVEGLVQELYSALLSENDNGNRKARLSRLRVFVVLDDVQTPSQLEQLLLREALNYRELFAAGSRIIVTTRNQRVLEYAKAEIHVVDHLSNDESLQLFKLSAFRPGSPVDHRIDLSDQVVSYCKGNPLAIKVLGGSLLDKDIKYWESFLLKLNELQEPEIHHVLRRSYDELGGDDAKLFLDIACSFHEILRSLLTKYLETSYTSAHSRVQDLIDKSMLICDPDKKLGEVIMVHDLLREMAWNIVNEEKDVGKRSRLKNPDSILQLLTVKKGDKATLGISLNLSRVEQVTLKANAFEGMDYLRWLEIYWPKQLGHQKIRILDGSLNYLPDEMRGLNWDQFPSNSLPSGFSPKKLFNLIITNSPIERCWELQAQPKLQHLIVLNLSYCEKLTTIPNLWSSSKLEHLICRGCKCLVELPTSVQPLVKLVRLDARDCLNLVSVPARLNSKFLKQLLLSNCPKLTRCPEINSGELEALDLDGTPITTLPNAISKVKQGGMVSLFGEPIINSPEISTSLELLRLCNTAIREMEFDHHQEASDRLKFDRLHLIHNTQLKILPRSIWKQVSVELIVRDSPLIERLPEISEPLHLTALHIAGCAGITDVSSCISKMKFLHVLALPATGIKTIPSCIRELDQLSYLDLSYCESLESIPNTIHELVRLSELLLMCCKNIQSLPELPPNLKILYANNCTSLQVLSSNIGNLSFQHLRLDGCPQLNQSSLDELMTKFSDQALPQHSQVGFQYSGSEIPEWFGPPSMEECNCVMLELPADCTQLKGVAFSVVYSLNQPCGSMSILCGCFVETEMVTYWRSFSWQFHVLDSSDRVYLWSGNKLGDSKKDGGEDEEAAWYEKYAGLTVSFRFFADVGATTLLGVKKCGAMLLY